MSRELNVANNEFLEVAGINCCESRKVKKLHFIIWISMEVLSETPTASLFDDFFTLKPIFASDYCRLLQRTEA